MPTHHRTIDKLRNIRSTRYTVDRYRVLRRKLLFFSLRLYSFKHVQCYWTCIFAFKCVTGGYGGDWVICLTAILEYKRHLSLFLKMWASKFNTCVHQTLGAIYSILNIGRCELSFWKIKEHQVMSKTRAQNPFNSPLEYHIFLQDVFLK